MRVIGSGKESSDWMINLLSDNVVRSLRASAVEKMESISRNINLAETCPQLLAATL
jgi:hypothetical protein